MFDPTPGLLKKGVISSYDKETREVKIKLNESQAINGTNNTPVVCQMPFGLYFNNGMFVGTDPIIGTPVVVGQGIGNKYYIVSFLSENTSAIPETKKDELLIKSSDKSKIVLSKNSDILIGSDANKIHINTGSISNPKTNLITFNFENENHFTQASRKINGLIKRDINFNTNYDQNSKLENDDYDNKYKIIGMDPSATSNNSSSGANKNPGFVENREIVYEFQNSSNILSDELESFNYSTSKKTNNLNYSFPNRRKSRADTLSLSLVEPNFLMEITKGTVVDIFGNILDINRNPLPIGKDKFTIRQDKSEDKQKSFLLIKELERKSIGFHFEMNSRKNLFDESGRISSKVDIDSNEDNSRLRSRFFFDIDKEGQFKMNVPASSETGNISLLTRYENYSTFGKEDEGNPNKLFFRKDNLDIFSDSFASPEISFADVGLNYSKSRGSISIKDGDAEATPIDRITKSHIKHGMAHHDILKTCFIHQNNQFIDYQKGTVASLTIDLNLIPELKNIVSDSIQTSGKEANAGGRSGVINFDGSLELNVGANTVDRQSLWLDTAGGVVANIGRDKNMRSAAIGMSGDLYMQIGGFGIEADSRFVKENNGYYGAVVDLRISGAGGYAHMIRIDSNGISIMTPGNIAVHAAGNMKLSADRNMALEAENITIQRRTVLKMGDSI